MNYRQKANITLAAVFIFFLVAAVLKHFNSSTFGIRLFYFVAEAALVGGIADWFAVTALFKKPLGWPYHTALIPRNREKVIDSVASMVQKELLRMDLIHKKIEGIPFVEGLLRIVDQAGGTAYLTDKLTTEIRRYAEKQDPILLAEKLTNMLQMKAMHWPLAPQLKSIKQWALRQGLLEQGMDQLVDGLWEKAAEGETRHLIVRFLEQVKQEKVSSGSSLFRTLMGFAEASDGLNLDDAAEALQVELLLTLHQLKDPEHPLRLALKDALWDALTDLEQDAGFAVQIEQWKADILSEPSFKRLLEQVIQRILKGLAAPSDALETDHLYQTCHALIETIWKRIQDNERFREKVQTLIVDAVSGIIQKEHDVIGAMVKETLVAYTDEDLNQFIEEKAGNDLQWIRINGSMIGGVVGIFLFLFLDLVYDPYLLPTIAPVLKQFLH